jgi:hypothetical protein
MGQWPPRKAGPKGCCSRKLWLAGGRCAHSAGFSPAQRRTIRHIVQQHHAELSAKWNESLAP